MVNWVKKRSVFLLLLAAVMLGLALRLPNLGEPFWGDETLSLDVVRHFSSLGEMVRYLSEVEFHPPLFYVLLHYWVAAFGISEFAVRLLTVAFGLGCIVAAYYFSSALFKNKAAGVAAAFITAILPFQIKFSQEARPYIAICFFGILAALWIYKYYESPRIRFLAGYILASLAGLYMHYSYAFVLAATILWALYQAVFGSRDRFRGFVIWLGAHAGIFLGFAWWLPAFLYKIFLGNMELFGMGRRALPLNRSIVFFDKGFSNLIWFYRHDPGSRMLAMLAFGAKAVLLLIFFKVFHSLWADGRRKKALIYLAWLALAIFAVFLFSPVSVAYNDIIEKHVILVSIIFAALAGLVITALPKKPAVAAAAIVVISLIPFVTDIMGDDSQWNHFYKMKEISMYINDHYEVGDLVVVPQAFFRSDAAFYMKNDEIPIVSLTPENYFDLDIWNSRRTLGIVENEYQTRIYPVSSQAVRKKLSALNKLRRPRRIWLFGFQRNEFLLHEWLTENQFAPVFRPEDEVFRIQLYAKA